MASVRLTTGAKAGIGIGIGLASFTLVIVVLAWFYFRRPSRRVRCEIEAACVFPAPCELDVGHYGPCRHEPAFFRGTTQNIAPVDCPSRPEPEANGISKPQKIATRETAADPVRSYGSDVTVVESNSLDSHTAAKGTSTKRILGLDDRTFLDRLPYFEAAQSTNVQPTFSAAHIGMNPWDLDVLPNPVHFPQQYAVAQQDFIEPQIVAPVPQSSNDESVYTAECPCDNDVAGASVSLPTNVEHIEPARLATVLASRNPWKTQLSRLPVEDDCDGRVPSERSGKADADDPRVDEASASTEESIIFRVGNATEKVSRIPPESYDNEDLYTMSPARWDKPQIETRMSASDRVASVRSDARHSFEGILDQAAARSSTESSHTSPLTWRSSPDTASTAPSSHNGDSCRAKTSPAKIESPPLSMSLISVMYAATPVESIKAEKTVEYQCPATSCNLSFRTKGQRTHHYNRKHNLRFVCELSRNGAACRAPFGLRADLERHKRTVHQAKAKSSRTLKCTNSWCATPEKIWPRKDNLVRHIQRCKRETSKAQLDTMPE